MSAAVTNFEFAKLNRISIEQVTPTLDEGRFCPKRIVGESVHIEADIFIDGHDKLKAEVCWKHVDDSEWKSNPLTYRENDRWQSDFMVERLGRYEFFIRSWLDTFGTYRYGLTKKISANVAIALEIQEGALLIQKAVAHKVSKKDGHILSAANKLLRIHTALQGEHSSLELLKEDFQDYPINLDSYSETQRWKLSILLSDDLEKLMGQVLPKLFLETSKPFPLTVERKQSLFASWYEMFPRSQSNTQRHGTFEDVRLRLNEISSMGFDTLYFTPIHPIGRKHRKGPNNAISAGESDPGSPYAIGSSEGGHDAIHPELGNWEDFRRLRNEAAELGIEIALDFAIQCSPDHPWLKEHPDWFDWRPDGSIKYAENPPKQYQDIVNVDFYSTAAIPELWVALKNIVVKWISEGVFVFRVDNPHTKPFPFWEWLIAEIKTKYPEVIFLSEAFTTPKIMYRLSKLGFSQSYTYFTWRNSKYELIQYLSELTSTPVAEFFRPNFFVNTPDINPFFLQNSGRAGFLIRAALASTLSGLWGISSGFELCESDAIPGKEEFNHSEKYEIRHWDWHRPGNIIREISLLNNLRKNLLQLQTHLGLTFHASDNDHVLFYSKSGGREPHQRTQSLVLVAVNLDPFSPQEANVELPLYMLGMSDEATVQARDLVNDIPFEWHRKWHRIRLDPNYLPFSVWLLQTEGQPS